MKFKYVLWTLAMAAVLVMTSRAAEAQVILNEANTMDSTSFNQTGAYGEGFDYGVVQHSGSTGNQYPVNDTNVLPGTASNFPTSLPNGWNTSMGFGRIQGDGGNWIELAVTQDHSNLSGYTFNWSEQKKDANGDYQTHSGYIKLSNDPIWSNMRAGQIITISDSNSAPEIRDQWPQNDPSSGFLQLPYPPGTNPTNTGYSYDLSTNTEFDPIANGTATNAQGSGADWHRQFYLNEGITNPATGTAQNTQYFAAGSSLALNNHDWSMTIKGASGNVVQGPIGEASPNWGTNTGAGGVNSEEVINNDFNPTTGESNANYEDCDWSTFGLPNIHNPFTTGTNQNDKAFVAQDFSTLRSWVANVLPGDANYDGTVGLADFAIWKAHNGQAGTWMDGNFSGGASPTVGLADFAAWKANNGNSSPSSTISGASAVPEPASISLMLLGGTLLTRRRRKA